MMREYPFAAFVGQEKAKRALLAALINPGVSGCLLTGETGCGKSVLVNSLEALFPERRFSFIPLGVSEDNLTGTLDIRELMKGRVQLQKGLMDTSPGTVVVLDDINLFRDSITAFLTQARDSSFSGEDMPVFIGMMNPKEGLLSGGLLSRFGLCVSMKAERKPRSKGRTSIPPPRRSS